MGSCSLWRAKILLLVFAENINIFASLFFIRLVKLSWRVYETKFWSYSATLYLLFVWLKVFHNLVVTIAESDCLKLINFDGILNENYSRCDHFLLFSLYIDILLFEWLRVLLSLLTAWFEFLMRNHNHYHSAFWFQMDQYKYKISRNILHLNRKNNKKVSFQLVFLNEKPSKVLSFRIVKPNSQKVKAISYRNKNNKLYQRK